MLKQGRESQEMNPNMNTNDNEIKSDNDTITEDINELFKPQTFKINDYNINNNNNDNNIDNNDDNIKQFSCPFTFSDSSAGGSPIKHSDRHRNILLNSKPSNIQVFLYLCFYIILKV